MGNVLDCSAETKKDDDDTEEYARQHGVPNTRAPAVNADALVVERGVPLRDSKLWKIQRDYYEKFGMQCWESMVVPSFVTSNAFIAQQTARVIAGYIRDCLVEKADQNGVAADEPVYIIEVGAGHGKFSFLVLQALMEMAEAKFIPELKQPSSTPAPPSEVESHADNANGGSAAGAVGGAGVPRRPAFMYIVTDISQKALDAIAAHPAMRQFIGAGVLEMAIFDAQAPVPAASPLKLKLMPSGDSLDLSATAPGQAVTDILPPLFICNYVLDSLLQDAFRIEDGALYENRVTVRAAVGDGGAGGGATPLQQLKQVDALGLKAMDGVQIAWSHKEYKIPNDLIDMYYGGDGADRGGLVRGAAGDEEFSGLLHSYLVDAEREFGSHGASLLMPLGALRLLRRLHTSLPGGRFTVLVGDKGYGTAGEMRGGRDPHIATHGSFSCMVNMDALARYAVAKGGDSLCTPFQEGFKCQALSFGLQGGLDALPEFSMAWDGAFGVFGPESFSALQRAVKEEVPEASLKHVTALLRLSGGDPDVFFKFKAALVQHVSSAVELSPSAWADLREDVSQVAGNNYHLQAAKDVSFEAGRLLMAMKDFKAALQLFAHSKATCGDHPATLLNMGMSSFCSGDYLLARDYFRQCVAINPSYEDGLQWLAHAERVISSGAGGPVTGTSTDVADAGVSGNNTGQSNGKSTAAQVPEADAVDADQG